MNLNVKRAGKEFSQLHAAVQKGESGSIVSIRLPDENDVCKWEVVLAGPAATPYAGGFFRMSVVITADYPHKAPVLRFTIPVWHPGVSVEGKLCEALFNDWAPTMSVRDALLRIDKLLAAPTDFEMINESVTKQLQDNRAEFERQAAAQTKQHAKR
jgi:ubiquitin-protein ligase